MNLAPTDPNRSPAPRRRWPGCSCSSLLAAAGGPGRRLGRRQGDRASVGERPDGYLGVVSASAPADAKALADSINAKRKQHYAKIAGQEGIDTAAVAARAGAKLRQRAAAGPLRDERQAAAGPR